VERETSLETSDVCVHTLNRALSLCCTRLIKLFKGFDTVAVIVITVNIEEGKED